VTLPRDCRDRYDDVHLERAHTARREDNIWNKLRVVNRLRGDLAGARARACTTARDERSCEGAGACMAHLGDGSAASCAVCGMEVADWQTPECVRAPARAAVGCGAHQPRGLEWRGLRGAVGRHERRRATDAALAARPAPA
jgi:hypothetical protein